MTLTIDFDRETEEQLAAMARERGVDTPSLIKQMVTQNLQSAANGQTIEFGDKTFGELFGDLIGAVEGGPPDLSARPEKYLQGFGKFGCS